MEVKLSSISRTVQTTTPTGEKKTETVTYRKGDAEFDTFEAEALAKAKREITLPKNFMGPETVSLYNGPMMGEKIRSTMEQYHSGAVDAKAVENTMSRIVSEIRSTYVGLGFDPAEFMPQVIEDVYDTARLYNVNGAFEASYQDSLPYAAEQNGHDGNTKDWIYYDADYYYSTEEMKSTLQGIAEKIGERYGVSASELDLQTDYPDGDIRKGIYSSYNTIVCDNARNSCFVGSVIDETVAPPEGFKFFYKGNQSGTNLLVPTLKAPYDEPEAAFDGALKVWYGDWSFTGRVPVRQNPDKFPISVNMLDVVSNQIGQENIPSEITDFLGNFDFFAQFQSGRYMAQHPRII